MARRRKPGRPKGSKNKKKGTKARAGRRKSKATPAQLRALKKARKVRAQKLGKVNAKGQRVKKKMTKKRREQLRENLKKARAARELKAMPKTRRMALKQLHHDMMADTVRAGIPLHQMSSGAPSLLRKVRRHMPTMVSRYN